MKDLSFQKDLAALSSPGLTTAMHHVSPGDTGSPTLQVESLEGSNKKQMKGNAVVGNPSDPELERRLMTAYDETTKSYNSLISLMKTIHPEASDVFLEKVAEWIMKAGGPNNFVTIIKNSDVLK
jgi:hypothetical protein